MRDSKIHIIKLLMKPNLLVRKTEQGQATKENTFSKKKKKKKIKICIYVICVTFYNFAEDKCFASKNI